jgi:hypothetical protein
MITAEQIQNALGLTGVTLYEEAGKAYITADQPVTEVQQELVQTWVSKGTTKVTSVRNAQLRQWLIDQNLDELVEGKLASSDTWPDIKTWKKAKARYEYEPNVNRTDALVIAMGQDLGFTDEQLDAAFNEMSLIP